MNSLELSIIRGFVRQRQLRVRDSKEKPAKLPKAFQASPGKLTKGQRRTS